MKIPPNVKDFVIFLLSSVVVVGFIAVAIATICIRLRNDLNLTNFFDYMSVKELLAWSGLIYVIGGVVIGIYVIIESKR